MLMIAQKTVAAGECVCIQLRLQGVCAGQPLISVMPKKSVTVPPWIVQRLMGSKQLEFCAVMVQEYVTPKNFVTGITKRVRRM
jgi:hypothetical protein